MVEDAGFGDAFASANPHQTTHRQDLNRLLDRACEVLHSSIVRGFETLPVVAAYRNALALSAQDSYLLACLLRTMVHSGDSDLDKIVSSLETGLAKRVSGDPGLLWLLDSTALAVGELPKEGSFRPALRLRYALASMAAKEFDATDCLVAASSEPGCSRLAGQRELKAALASAVSKDIYIARISQKAFRILPMHAQMLLCTEPRLFQYLMDEQADPDTLTNDVRSRWERRLAVRDRLREISLLLVTRSIDQANTLAVGIPLQAIDERLKKEMGPVILKRLANQPKSATDKTWIPVSPQLRRIITRTTGKRSAAASLSLSLEEFFSKVSQMPNFSRNFAGVDLQRLKNSCSQQQLKALAAAGRFDLAENLAVEQLIDYLPQLIRAAQKQEIARGLLEQAVEEHIRVKDAPALLQSEAGPYYRALIATAIDRGDTVWLDTFMPHLGTPTAATILSPSPTTIAEAIALLQTGGAIVDRKAFQHTLGEWFRSSICDALRSGHESHSGRHKNTVYDTLLDLAAQYDEINPDFTEKLSQALGFSQCIELFGRCVAGNTYIANLLAQFTSREQQTGIAMAKVRRSGTPEALLEALKSDPKIIQCINVDLLDAINLKDDSPSRVATVLCLCKAPNTLQKYLRTLPLLTMRESLQTAATLLAATSRHRGYLELVATLGFIHVRSLAALLYRSARDLPAGHKLDNEYSTYQLPKKSGGNRTVSVPSPLVKRTQRAILRLILDPLGSHEAAHGFMLGKSIKTNAARHTGQHIVVNCDISNCFPSVKWPLVLGALRRDLGEAYSPAAISLLVDVCTAHGGLPIGAPTSPALLNRVLFLSDQVLHEAATSRDCSYTRYADDLTFSGDDEAVKLLGIAKRTIGQIGLELDGKKTNIYRRGRRQIVTGLVVNETVNMPRRARRKLRAAVHAAENGRPVHWHDQPSSILSLEGRLGFLHSVNPAASFKLRLRLKKVTTNSDD